MSKTVTLKTGTENFHGRDIPVSTKDLIAMALDQPPKEGFTFSELKKRLRVQDAVDKSDGLHVDFEDNDYETLKTCSNNAGWTVRTKFLYDYLEQFNS
jgi:hypothetical protein